MPALTTTHAATQKRDGRVFDEVSDAVDEGQCTFSAARHLDHGLRSLILSAFTVNVQKLKLWDDESAFDAEKDKARFRQYEDACDRVKNFYKEQHGMGA
jgi:inositol oxygenase